MSLNFDAVALLGKVLAVLAILATKTKSKVDDAVVAALQAAYDDETIRDWLNGEVAKPENADGVFHASQMPEDVKQAFGRRGIDWANVLVNLPAILAIVKSLL